MLRSFIPVLTCALALATATHADEYQLKTGRRIPLERVKVTGENYTATLPSAATGGTETVNFTLKDIAQVLTPEPAELVQARKLVVEGRYSDAADSAKKAMDKTKDMIAVPGSWWPEAMMTQLDALSSAGKPVASADGTDDATLKKLPSEDRDAVSEMKTIASASKDAKPETIDEIKRISQNTANSWVKGRAWLQIGNIYSNKGDMESAVRSWLRVPVFSGAEKDLALRGTVAAARGLQQMSLPNDGIQLLDDYLRDNPVTSFQDLIEAEKKKLTPKEKKTAAVEESK